VIAATFSNPDRFPSLAVKVASALGLPASTPAFDLQMACSAYPYALYLAGKLAADLGGRVLVVDGDVQSPLVDTTDHATGAIFSDACTASVVSCRGTSAARSYFDFLSRADGALECPAQGPIKMDGFAVFSFVATEVSKFIGTFLDSVAAESGSDPRSLQFAPHQANPYMVRRLADALGLSSGLLTIPDDFKNPGSCSVPMALAMKGKPGPAVIAGFGAGLSASVGIVRLAEGFHS
jgi:3-oxoacyl-[acyl-carrier-protein] synthase-3